MKFDETLKSKEVFNYLFEKAQQEGIPLTPMQAIKLVYFSHAWYLGFHSQPLLNEPIQAWRFGTVIPSLYHSLKIYGSGNIRFPILKDQAKYALSLALGTGDFPKDEVIYPNLTKEEKAVVDAVWDSYKNFDGITMSNIIHQAGTPWSTIWNGGHCGRYAVIPDSLIEAYYKRKIKKADDPDDEESK
ncbi:type II toxin-antitoxin system antitoxin SocA domain-containing protein [uncultured Rikenella sp.]|uniref:Panacea domain-containing protein n=1 Tax=uncultured Rikenella sp. TaxID=368003 RepID=UPI0025F65F4E|nr:type II toxin-antitoxin system antitoxin SocA domain-containing protein [uncultured Rikenella sp.]